MYGNHNSPQPQPFGLQDQMTNSAQKTVPVIMFGGTRKIAFTAISKVYNLRSAPAPNSRPGKK